MFRYLENLVSNEAKLTDEPSKHALLAFPRSKKALTAMSKDPSTGHCYLSGWEGISRNERVSKDNPPVSCLGVIVDLDCEPVLLNFNRGYEPSYVSRSISGGFHLHYVFSQPVHFGRVQGLAEKFLLVLEDKLALEALPGYDRNAFRKPSQYYEVGREWEGSGVPLDGALVSAWVDVAAKKFQWNSTEDEAVPIDKVRETLSEKYPGKWPGGWSSFDVGARGVRFWDDDADSFSVIVRETGLTCFTSARGFIPWRDEDLLGAKEVAQYVETSLTDPSRDMWFDGNHYWKPNHYGHWVSRNETQIKEDLRNLGLSNRSPEGGGAPPVSLATMLIRDSKELDVVSLFYTPPGVVSGGSTRKELNVSDVQAMRPASEAGAWGENFPRLAEFLEMFLDPTPRARFLAHLSHAYACGVHGKPQRGLGCIIAGPVGNGKTFTANRICGTLLGGAVDASPYLVDGDQFNSNLVQSPVWTLDDVANKASWAEHSRFSKSFKRALANDDIPCRAMYRAPIMVRWTGRIYMTANDDYESLNALPRTDINIKDKLLILKANGVKMEPWVSDSELEEELPHLGAWVLVAEHDLDHVGGRFGVRPWVDPELERKMTEVGPRAPGDEILATFRRGLTEPWVGMCSDLFDHVIVDNSTAAAKTFRNPQALGWYLKDKIDHGDPGYSKKRTSAGQRYTIQPLELDQEIETEIENEPF
tara:strand:+ start:2317 stop:4419 length:2103 start_codon:yes stop_codon:yes gene_type:complete